MLYRIHTTKSRGLSDEEKEGQVLLIHSPAEMPDPQKIDYMEEPWIKATIMTPDEYLVQF